MTEEERRIEEEMLKAFENSQDQPAPAAEAPTFEQLDPPALAPEKDKRLDMIYDLSLPVAIELGRTNLPIKEILDLQRGSIVEFEKLASEPVDILVNGKKMAEGEVVVIEKHFGIRITSLVEHNERLKGSGR
ncbi:MAG: flagellar motor switch protein FliN [Ignavibacteriales bacterium]|nr:flagellar motor switch protein FliN [Ignavibacteriales bacterium]